MHYPHHGCVCRIHLWSFSCYSPHGWPRVWKRCSNLKETRVGRSGAKAMRSWVPLSASSISKRVSQAGEFPAAVKYTFRSTRTTRLLICAFLRDRSSPQAKGPEGLRCSWLEGASSGAFASSIRVLQSLRVALVRSLLDTYMTRWLTTVLSSSKDLPGEWVASLTTLSTGSSYY